MNEEWKGYYIEVTDAEGIERYDENDEMEFCDGVFVEVWLSKEDAMNGVDPFDYYALAVGHEIKSKDPCDIKRVIVSYTKNY